MSKRLNDKIKIIEDHVEKGNAKLLNLVKYKNNRTKLYIMCKCGTIFPRNWHTMNDSKLDRVMCRRCMKLKMGSNYSLSREEYISRLNQVSKDRDYTLITPLDKIKNINAHIPIRVKCNKEECQHEWTTTINHLCRGSGCPKCANFISLTFEEIVENIRNKYNGEYIILNKGDDYKNVLSPLLVKHKNCGYIWTTTYNRLHNGNNKCNCPDCNSKTNSKISKTIKKYIKNREDIYYKLEVRFDDCRGLNLHLPFDFGVYDKHTNELLALIEANGSQHYTLKSMYNPTYTHLIKNQLYDGTKIYYCMKNNIKLITVTYKDSEEDINKILEEEFKNVL